MFSVRIDSHCSLSGYARGQWMHVGQCLRLERIYLSPTHKCLSLSQGLSSAMMISYAHAAGIGLGSDIISSLRVNYTLALQVTADSLREIENGDGNYMKLGYLPNLASRSLRISNHVHLFIVLFSCYHYLQCPVLYR